MNRIFYDEFGARPVWVLGAVFVVAFGLVIGMNFLLSAKSCTQTGAVMGRETQWGVWTDCMIRADNDHWVPLDRWIANEESTHD